MFSTIQVTINPKPQISYNILLGNDILNKCEDWLPNNCSSIVIVTDKILENFYAQKLVANIEERGYKVLLFVVEPGEESKTNKVKEYIELSMLKNKCDRRTLMIALGGGVIGDLTGFIASTYMRGINYIQMPTTLLSILDSSVGGKTAINTPYGKNLIGAIWQPLTVVTDLYVLKTLPQMHLVNGLIEAIKIFLTLDNKSFIYLKKNLAKILKREEKTLSSIIKRAVKLKAHVVRIDEREENLRMILNFGHTVGHAIEKASNYEILHGICVGLGIIVEAKIALLLNKLSEAEFRSIIEILGSIGITAEMLQKFDKEELINNMLIDKKNKNGDIYMILLNSIGSVAMTHNKVASIVNIATIRNALKELSI